jgi:hypothetical protein
LITVHGGTEEVVATNLAHVPATVLTFLLSRLGATVLLFLAGYLSALLARHCGAVGLSLPERKIQINTLSVVNQRGPERSWDWHPEAAIQLGISS